MGKYSVEFDNFATATGLLTAIRLPTAASKKAEIVYASMSGAAAVTPADIAHQLTLWHLDGTGAGTPGSSPTPELFDQYQAASGLAPGIKYTVEPTTYGAIALIKLGFNQRSGMWWGVPSGDGIRIGNELTKKHAGMRVKSNAVGAVDGCMHWIEP